mmetsp:Transcript_19969/g.55594  ORF Transcript_19969/g.55594 Transcript_19969/m.55594 type:complete len:100 (+) Transcript_19969:522-821(+)
MRLFPSFVFIKTDVSEEYCCGFLSVLSRAEWKRKSTKVYKVLYHAKSLPDPIIRLFYDIKAGYSSRLFMTDIYSLGKKLTKRSLNDSAFTFRSILFHRK